jgi:hypothetical protein
VDEDGQSLPEQPVMPIEVPPAEAGFDSGPALRVPLAGLSQPADAASMPAFGGPALPVRGLPAPVPVIAVPVSQPNPSGPEFVQHIPAPMAAPAAPAVAPPAVAPAPDARAGMPEDTVIRITTRPPTPQELFRLETEQQLNARLQQESARCKDSLSVFETKVPMKPLLGSRGFPVLTEGIEPRQLCFTRLLFRPRGPELGGQEFGALLPFVSTGLFYYDLAKSPVTAVFTACTPVECSQNGELGRMTLFGW